MNVLDENVTRDLGHQGMADENVVPLLLRLKRPTLLTRDRDFFDRRLVHARYALVWFEVDSSETAFFIKRFLAHPSFRMGAQRLGKVIRVHAQAIEYWTKDTDRVIPVEWP